MLFISFPSRCRGCRGSSGFRGGGRQTAAHLAAAQRKITTQGLVCIQMNVGRGIGRGRGTHTRLRTRPRMYLNLSRKRMDNVQGPKLIEPR